MSVEIERFLGERVVVVYGDNGSEKSVVGKLESADENELLVQTDHGPTLIGRRSMIRLKLSRDVRGSR